MTKEQMLLAIAAALIVLGVAMIVSTLRRARRRDLARERVDALLTLVAESEMPAIAAAPARVTMPEPEVEREDPWEAPVRDERVFYPRRARPALAHPYVVTLSDRNGSFGVRPRPDRVPGSSVPRSVPGA